MLNFKINPILLSSILSTFLFIGCSDGVDSTTLIPTTIEGQLVDSYVENVDYTCGDGSVGVTDIDGKFKCDSLPVSFRVGSLKLGEILTMTTDNQIFPQDLVGVDRNDTSNSEVVAMARFLQSCDEDGDSSNGLKITQALKDTLTVDEEFSADNIDSYVTITVNEAVALEHLTQTTEFTDAVNNATLVPTAVKEALLTSNSILDQDLKNTLSYMGNEERLAYDVYNKLYESFPTLNQLSNIANQSEIAHIQTIQLLIKKYITDYSEFSNIDLSELNYQDTAVEDMVAGTYDISTIQNLYDALIEIGEAGEQQALEVGCMIEVTDINDLDRDITLTKDANATDVEVAFEFLRTASYSHYWAFDSGLVSIGITDGCCSLGEINGVNYCHSEYPKNEKGRGNATGDGSGHQYGRQ